MADKWFSMEIERIDHLSMKIPVESLENCLKFYRDTLGFEPFKLDEYRKGDRTSFFFRMGESAMLNIRPIKGFKSAEGSFDHFCIVVRRDISKLEDELAENGFSILRNGEPLGSEGRNPAIYVEDPFGNKIEIKQKN